jgi:hypothetical protein
MIDCKIMGVAIGTAKAYDMVDDFTILYMGFVPNRQVCKVPACDVSLDLIEGTWSTYDAEGKVLQNGLIFEQLA